MAIFFDKNSVSTVSSLVISSYDKKAIVKYKKYLLNSVKRNEVELVVSSLKKKKTLVSVLKSPHVNKSAQEQFCKFNFFYCIRVHDSSNGYFAWVLKTFKNVGFPNVNVVYNLKLTKKTVNPLLIFTEYKRQRNQVFFWSPQTYLKSLEVFGEVLNSKLSRKLRF